MNHVSTTSPRHRWNELPERRIHASETRDGNERTERTCPACGIVKITVHPDHGLAWREWRTKDGRSWTGDLTPSCIAQKAPELEVVSETTSEIISG